MLFDFLIFEYKYRTAGFYKVGTAVVIRCGVSWWGHGRGARPSGTSVFVGVLVSRDSDFRGHKAVQLDALIES